MTDGRSGRCAGHRRRHRGNARVSLRVAARVERTGFAAAAGSTDPYGNIWAWCVLCGQDREALMRLAKALMAAVASALILGACASPYGPEYAYSTDPLSVRLSLFVISDRLLRSAVWLLRLAPLLHGRLLWFGAADDYRRIVLSASPRRCGLAGSACRSRKCGQ